jgi:spermidine synthase
MGQILHEPNAILAVAVVLRSHGNATGVRVAWLDLESQLLVEPDRAVVDRCRHRTDLVAAACAHGRKEVLVEPSAQSAAALAGPSK